MTARLTIIEGPDEGAVFDLKDDVVLGRALDCQVQLKDLRVSRRHARITCNFGVSYIEDLGSGNGTFVNGQPVRGRQALNPGDLIKVSKVQLRFEEGAEAEDGDAEMVTMIGKVPAGQPQPYIVRTVDAMRSPFADTNSFTSIEELQRLTQRLNTVYAVSQAISSLLDLNELLPEVVNRLFSVFPSAGRALLMLHDEAGELVPKVVKHRDGEGQREIAVSHTILNAVRTQKQAVLSHDAMSDSRFLSGQSVANFGVRAMICAPLLWRGDTIGMVYLDSRSLGAFSQADLELLAGIAGQAAMAVGNATLHRELLKRQALEQDLHLAERIQQSFLPRRTPRISGYSFSSWYDPAYEIGGDFYDFIRLPQSRLGIVVGDVSGKGVSAALYMARLTRDLRYFALAELDPGRVMMWMNRAVLDAAQDDIFVTLVYAVLHTTTGDVTIANAGHMPPAIKTPKGVVVRDGVAGLPLGVLPETEYASDAYKLMPGETMLFYTDGLVEAMNGEREMFGSNRLLKSLELAPPDAPGMLEYLVKEMAQHVGGAAQFDDTTLVCVGLDARG